MLYVPLKQEESEDDLNEEEDSLSNNRLMQQSFLSVVSNLDNSVRASEFNLIKGLFESYPSTTEANSLPGQIVTQLCSLIENKGGTSTIGSSESTKTIST
jgi:hypothetical protein